MVAMGLTARARRGKSAADMAQRGRKPGWRKEHAKVREGKRLSVLLTAQQHAELHRQAEESKLGNVTRYLVSALKLDDGPTSQAPSLAAPDSRK